MMDKKKIIITGLIIIILASCLILIVSQNNTKDSDNYNQTNSTTKSNISNDTTKNSSFNTNQITKSAKNAVSRINNNQTIESGEKRNDSNKIINFNKKSTNRVSSTNNNNTDSNISDENDLIKVTPEDIKKIVESGVSWDKYGKDVRIGEPYLKDQYSESTYSGCGWLVPAFNKTSGEFVGAVYVAAPTYKDGNGTFGVSFMNGASSYSDYLDLISGKPITKPETILVEPENFTLNLTSFSNSSGADENNTISDNLILDTVDVRTDLNDDAIELNNSSCCE